MGSTEPENIRVNTPPRVITLDKYQFPIVDDKEEEKLQKDQIPVVKPRPKYVAERDNRIVTRYEILYMFKKKKHETKNLKIDAIIIKITQT